MKLSALFYSLLFVGFVGASLLIGCAPSPVPPPPKFKPLPNEPVMSPKLQAWEKWLNNEHMPNCTICKRAFEGADSAMCEEAFAKFQEALKD